MSHGSIYEAGGLNATEGWRHATPGEFVQLMNDYLSYLPQQTPGDWQSKTYLVDMLGVTVAISGHLVIVPYHYDLC